MSRRSARFIDRLPLLVDLVWPPCEARRADRHLKQQFESLGQAHEAIVAAFVDALSRVESSEAIVDEVERVSESERRRRELLEGKASGLLSPLSIVISLVLLVPAISEKAQQIPRHALIALAVIVALAVVHFLVAVLHAVHVNAVGQLYLPSTIAVDNLLKSGAGEISRGIVAAKMYGRAKMNEPVLTMKSNHLWVAQEMFRRAVVLLALAALVSVFYSAWRPYVAHTRSSIIVPAEQNPQRSRGPFE